MTRLTLFGGAAAAAVALAAPFMASAQATGAEGAVDELVVTGARLQNLRAIAQKRQAERIGDSITADEVGALPDFSLAEALTRVPAVTYEGRNGDAEFIVIRGLRPDFNFLEIDGAVVPSTRVNGRATQLSVIPSFIVRGTDVVKSFSADLDANAIGGHLSVRTLSAFDRSRPYFSARGAVGAFDHDDGPKDLKTPYRGDLALATRFGPDEQFGLVLGASYSLQDYDTWLPGVAFNRYRFLTPPGTLTTLVEDAPADAIRVPHGVQTYQYNNKIRREGLYGKLEWRPTETLAFALSAYRFEEDDTEQRWDTLIYRASETALPAQLTATSGFVNQAVVQRQYFLQGDSNVLRSATLSGAWTPAGPHNLSFLVTVADGERSNPFYQVRYEAANRGAFAYSYDSSGVYPTITPATPANWENDALFTPQFYRPRLDNNRQEAFQAKLDYGFNARPGDLGLGFKAGAAFRRDRREQDQVFDNDFRPNTNATRAASLADVRLDRTSGFDPDLIVGQPQIFIDEAAFLRFFSATRSEWRDAFNPAVEAVSTDFTVQEEIGAAYVMGRYALHALTLTAGLRHETTDLRSTGARRLDDADPATPEYPIVTEDAGYNRWLPSFSATWDMTDSLRVRAAFSRTLGRGEYSQLNVNGSHVVDDQQRTITVVSGAPGLAPRESSNFDLSIERYLPAVDGVLAVAVFHKDIDNEIFTRSTETEQVIGGVAYRLLERRPANANSARLTGIEAGATLNTLGFVHPVLADVGFSASYAHIDSRFSIEMANGGLRRLPGMIYQPKNVANVSLFWSPGAFEGRLAWRYSDRKLLSASSSSPSFDTFIGDERRLDAQVRYRLPRGVVVFAEARNITDGAEDQELSYEEVQWTRDYGRSVWLGLTYTF